jgi:hypothetical protein
MPGFPWRGSFSLPEGAEAYVSGERIQCLLFGKFSPRSVADETEEKFKSDAVNQNRSIKMSRNSAMAYSLHPVALTETVHPRRVTPSNSNRRS